MGRIKRLLPLKEMAENFGLVSKSMKPKLSFNLCSEGTRLKYCITLHKRLFGVGAKKIGGDTG